MNYTDREKKSYNWKMTEFQGYKSPLNFSRKIAFSRFHSSILLSLLLLLHKVSKSIFCMNFTTSKEFWKRLSHHIHTQKIFDLQFIVSQFWTFSKFFFVSFCLDSSNLVYFRPFLCNLVLISRICLFLSKFILCVFIFFCRWQGPDRNVSKGQGYNRRYYSAKAAEELKPSKAAFSL